MVPAARQFPRGASRRHRLRSLFDAAIREPGIHDAGQLTTEASTAHPSRIIEELSNIALVRSFGINCPVSLRIPRPLCRFLPFVYLALCF